MCIRDRCKLYPLTENPRTDQVVNKGFGREHLYAGNRKLAELVKREFAWVMGLESQFTLHVIQKIDPKPLKFKGRRIPILYRYIYLVDIQINQAATIILN